MSISDFAYYVWNEYLRDYYTILCAMINGAMQWTRQPVKDAGGPTAESRSLVLHFIPFPFHPEMLQAPSSSTTVLPAVLFSEGDRHSHEVTTIPITKNRSRGYHVYGDHRKISDQ
jgi:hypothetical protein